MDFINLKQQYTHIEQAVNERVLSVLRQGKYIMGPEVGELEKKLATFAGTRYCLTCASGTDALLLVLMAKGVGPGDAIFTTPFTFIATAEVISLLGATPIFVDINPQTFNIDPVKLVDSIDSLKKGKIPASGIPSNLRPRGIIPVDLFGLPAEYNQINEIAKDYSLFVFEDAAQSFGAEYNGKMACNCAAVAATSFFPAKPLGCYGDGGAVFTDDNTLFDILTSLRVHGKGHDKYDNVRIGINGRLDTIQAAVLLEKLTIFPDEINLRQVVAQRYKQGLGKGISTQIIPDGYRSAWAQYTVSVEHRDRVVNALKENSIPTMIYYPKPLHLQNAFSYLQYRNGDLPCAEDASRKVLSLPMHPYLDEEMQNVIIDEVNKCIV